MQAYCVSKRPPRALLLALAIALGVVAVSAAVLPMVGGGLMRDGTYLRILGYTPSDRSASLVALGAEDASQSRGQASEESGLGRVRVDDGHARPAHEADQAGQRGEVAPRRDLPAQGGHLDQTTAAASGILQRRRLRFPRSHRQQTVVALARQRLQLAHRILRRASQSQAGDDVQDADHRLAWRPAAARSATITPGLRGASASARRARWTAPGASGLR